MSKHTPGDCPQCGGSMDGPLTLPAEIFGLHAECYVEKLERDHESAVVLLRRIVTWYPHTKAPGEKPLIDQARTLLGELDS